MGRSPSPFYYGMWVPYVTGAAMTYDFEHDSDAAGYLSPYLRTQHIPSFNQTAQVLSIGAADVDKTSQAIDSISFGSVHLSNAR